MKVYVYPGDRWGCGSYRMAWPGRAIVDPSIDVEVVDPEQRNIAIEVDPRTQQATAERFPADADVIVFQRPTNRWVTSATHMLQARGVAVVVDMDDDLAHIHPQNPAWGMHQPVIRQGPQQARNVHSFRHATDACRSADLVTVSTVALAGSYGAHGRCVVLPNRVPAWYLDVPHDPSSTLIGWGGSVHSHPDDLQRLGPAIAQLVAAGHTFETVGDKADVARILGLRGELGGPGPTLLADYPPALARFGVGVAPLAATRFNRAKSWLKVLEYAAVGVPWVASPLDEYVRLHELGCGRLAEKPRHWASVLRQLLDSESLRVELSEAGRAVAAEHTIEGHAWRWAEAWASARDRQRSKV